MEFPRELTRELTPIQELDRSVALRNLGLRWES